MMKCALLMLYLLLQAGGLYAAEKDIIELSRSFYFHGEYYSAITELSRYQSLFPAGEFYAESLLFMGKAYFKGGNYDRALQSLTSCRETFADKPEGEEALYLMGYMRLTQGSPLFAYRNLQDYRNTYPSGRFIEEIDFYLVYSSLLLIEPIEASQEIKKYKESHKDGAYGERVKALDRIVMDEVNRPQKYLWASVLGSIFIPGFGHFYTGKYLEGVFSLVSNVLFGFLIYNGYRNNDIFQMVLFSVIELAFYQYNIYSAVRNVNEYNNRNDYYGKIRLSLSASSNF